MGAIAFLMTVLAAMSGTSVVGGRVCGVDGKAVEGARVFIEEGLEGSVRETRAARDGAFQFDGVGDGTVGVFAIADGFGFGGLSMAVPPGETVSGLTVTLRAAESIEGKIVDAKGKGIAGARVVRVGLLSEPPAGNPAAKGKVGIPLAKLSPLGFDMPASDANGQFKLGGLPVDGVIGLKVSHGGYAQEGVADIRAGDRNVRVTLQAGVLVRGTVVSREAKLPVANATISIRADVPPFDTVMTKTDGTGVFTVRLKPGVYAYQATSAELRSPGWVKLAVTGAQAVQETSLFVSGVATIKGKVADAVTGKPVVGARVLLEAFGNPSASVKTNSAGEYQFTGVAGENVVTLDSAPGYQPPAQNGLRANLAEGQALDLPAFWVMPIPVYELEVLDAQMKPVPGAVVSLLRPAQFGWRVADANGRVELQFGALPPDGTVVGLAEHGSEPLGALFAFSPSDASKAQVQLMPLGTVHGRVVNAKGSGVTGAVVGAAFAEDSPESRLLFWRTLSRGNGYFELSGVASSVMLRCAAHPEEGVAGVSEPFHLEGGAVKDVGNITLGECKSSGSVYGKALKWHDSPVIAGKLDKDRVKGRPAVVMYCKSDEAEMAVEGMANARSVIGDAPLCVVVVDGTYEGQAGDVPVLRGKAPALATTYVLDPSGRVVFETFGMPPVQAVRNVE